MATAFVTDARFQEHETPSWHPETPERWRAIMRVLKERGLLDDPRLLRLVPRPATDAELLAVHTPEHLAHVQQVAQRATSGNLGMFDEDTFAGPQSAAIARLAAGAVLIGVDAVMRGEATNAFAVVRPPGHHAEAGRAMGFCLFNNIAVAARYAQQTYGAKKVLICDFDVHHGNGTQAIFYDDPTVAYFSTHQSPFYPGTGAFDEIGIGPARYTTCNAPVPRDTILELYDAIYREVFVPFCDRFRPDLILLSAGFDAHWRDPMANVLLDSSGIALLTLRVREMAESYCTGRLVGVLEGGYELDALAENTANTLQLLLGGNQMIDSIGPSPWPGTHWNIDAVVDELKRVQNLYGYRRKPRPAGPVPGMAEDQNDLHGDHDDS